MTVSSATNRSGPYAGAGTTGPFTIGFPFLDDEHLLVLQIDAADIETTLLLATEYTVTGAGTSLGGTLTLTTALPVGETLTIQRQVPITQLLDYTQSDAFPAESHEQGLDKLTMIDQQLATSIAGTLRVPETATELPAFPALASRASKFMVFDSSGDPAVVSSLPDEAFTQGNAIVDAFTGDGVTVDFTLSENPGTEANLDVAVGGVTQSNGTDFSWTAGTTLSFVVAPPNTVPVQARYTNALPVATIGESSVRVSRSLSGGSTTTQRAINAAEYIDVGPNFGMVTGRYLTGAQRIANFDAWVAADAAAALVKGQLRLPAGDIEIDCGVGSLVPSYGVEWYGHGTLATTIWDYSAAAGITLDLLNAGAGSPPADRTITTVGLMTFDGTNAGNSRQGMRIGRNYRSSPLTRGLAIFYYGHYGLNIAANCWDTSMDHLQIAGCGTRAANSSGVYLDPTVTDLNDFTFICPKIEANGSASSAAGGWNMQGPGGGTNRGITIVGGVTQGNNGTDEAYFLNMHGLTFVGHYCERSTISGYTTGFEFEACDGVWIGGVNAGSSGFNTQGLLFTAGSRFEVRGVRTSGWVTADIVNQGSILHTSGLPSATTYSSDATAQWFGDYAPRFEASLSANQTGVVTNVWTKVRCNTETFDTTGAYDNATNYRFTPRSVREYMVVGMVTFSAADDGDELLTAIYKNGVLYKLAGRVRASGTSSQTIPVSAWIVAGAATDYFELYVRHTAAADKIITSGTDTHWGAGLPG